MTVRYLKKDFKQETFRARVVALLPRSLVMKYMNSYTSDRVTLRIKSMSTSPMEMSSKGASAATRPLCSLRKRKKVRRSIK